MSLDVSTIATLTPSALPQSDAVFYLNDSIDLDSLWKEPSAGSPFLPADMLEPLPLPSLSRVFGFARRLAYRNGFLQSLGLRRLGAWPPAASIRAEPQTTGDTTLHIDAPRMVSESTFFVASQRISVTNRGGKCGVSRAQLAAPCQFVFALVHIGGSSFSTVARLFCSNASNPRPVGVACLQPWASDDDVQTDEPWTEVAQVVQCVVRIGLDTRRPAPLSTDARESVMAALAVPHRAAIAAKSPLTGADVSVSWLCGHEAGLHILQDLTLARLPHSGLAVFSVSHPWIPVATPPPTATSAAGLVAIGMYIIRATSDIDFNGHLNQGVHTAAVDAALTPTRARSARPP